MDLSYLSRAIFIYYMKLKMNFECTKYSYDEIHKFVKKKQ